MAMKIEDCISNWQNSLLDTTKRNRLIKFSHGRAGMFLISPQLPQFWELINEDNGKLVFPWKRDLLKIPHEEVEAWEEALERSSQGNKSFTTAKNELTVSNSVNTQITHSARKEPGGQNNHIGKESPHQMTIAEVTKQAKCSKLLKSNHIITDYTDRKLNSSLLKLSRTASESEQEHGVSTLFLAFGFLKWYESQDSNEPIYSPLVLLQAKLERAAVDAPWEVSLEEDDLVMNHCLRESLEKEFRIKLPMQDPNIEETAEIFPILAYFDQVRNSIASLPRWEVTQGVGLGIFKFQKLAMWEDLGRNAKRIAQHPHCLAISGIKGTMEDLCNDPISAHELDEKIHPKENHQILVADSSQQEAIEQVKRGANMVIDGPPGTGKSQTIANMIAEIIGQGKTVLFVSEKMAALEVVKKRLDEKGLGDFCLPLHSNKANKKEVLADLNRCLDRPKEKIQDFSGNQEQLFAIRKKLNDYVRELHIKRTPFNKSIYEMHGILAGMAEVQSNSKWAPKNIQALDQEYLRIANDIIETLPKFQTIFSDFKTHPWHQCKINSTSQLMLIDLERHLEKIAEYFTGIIAINAPQYLEVLEEIRTLEDWESALYFARNILAVPLMPKFWFANDPLIMGKLAWEINTSKTQLDELQKSLCDFQILFLNRVTPAEVKDLLVRLKLPEHNGTTITISFRRRIEAIRDAIELYPKIQNYLVLISKIYNEITNILDITNRSSTLQIAEFAKVVKFLSKRQPIPRSWWDKLKRVELIEIAQQSINTKIRITDLRFKLIIKLSLDKATEPESIEAIKEGLLSGGDWWRMDEAKNNLTCFQPLFVEQATPPIIKDLLCRLNLPGQNGSNSSIFFHLRIESLRNAIKLYPRMVNELVFISNAYNEIAKLLNIKNIFPTGQIVEFANVVNFLTNRLPIPEGWWEKQKRAELFETSQQGERSQIIITDLRLKLITKIKLDKAMDPESVVTIREGLLFGGCWWRRFLPKWGKLRIKIASWYLVSPPDLPTILADLSLLDELQRHVSLTVQITRGFSDHWIYQEDGSVDWQKNVEELRHMETVEKFCKSDSLKNKLGVNGSLDRGALGILTEQVAEQMELVVKEWPGLACVFFPNEVSKGLDNPLAQLLEKLETIEGGLRVELSAWEELLPLLEFNLKISLGELKDKFTKLDEYAGSYFPKWGEFRTKISSWYLISPPDLPTMLADLSLLDELHREESLVVQITRRFLDHWIYLEEGSVDWQKNVEELRHMETVEKFCKSDSLKNKLGVNGSLDRGALGILTEQVSDLMESVIKEWPSIACVFFPNEISKGLDNPLAQLLEKLETIEMGLRVELSGWEELLPLLEFNLEINLGELKEMFTKLDEYAALRSGLDKMVDQYKPESCDWDWRKEDWGLLSVAGKSFEEFMGQQSARLNDRISSLFYDNESRSNFEIKLIEAEKFDLNGMKKSMEFIEKNVFSFKTISSYGIIIDSLNITDVGKLFSRLGENIGQLQEWVQFKRCYKEAGKLGLKIILDEVLLKEYKPELAAAVFKKRFYSILIDELKENIPELSNFSTEDHETKILYFNKLDQESISQASSKIRIRLINSNQIPSISILAPPTSELGVLLRETQKKRKHLPLRKLFTKIPTILPRLKPCFMMSPLAVSTFLGSADWEFNVVIFDEASQVRPHDAICAVCRGKQLVVAGDPKQLPPSNFFEKASFDDDDNEGEEGTECFESLLDVCLTLGMRRQRLKWHYRSRREELIAFSNYHFYENSLITFPSVHVNSENPLGFTYLPNGIYENNVNVIEARKIAEMVMEHFQNTPNQSLGVIAFSVSQQNRILDELETQRRAKPYLEDFFATNKPERFFVKNLENVQGDERDVIFLGIGYGPNSAGKVFMRFGPLNLNGGERRLNVAVTRARTGMKVISSLMPDQLNLLNTQALGARLLRSFLDYAARGTVALSQEITSTGPGFADSPFEEAVFDALIQRGLKLQKQVGCGGYRIDLAVLDNKVEGKYLLGIECDGATYHSSATARDRDRLRQQVLENLGWSICRIWSTDWVQNRENQIKRVFEALERVKNGSYVNIQSLKPTKETCQELLLEDDTEDMEPGFDYKSIAEVPDNIIRELVQKTLLECGATEQTDLIRTVSQKLGFRRLGINIERKIEKTLKRLSLNGRLHSGPNGKLSWRTQESWIQPEIQD